MIRRSWNDSQEGELAEINGLSEILQNSQGRTGHPESNRIGEFQIRLFGLLSDTSKAFLAEDCLADAVGFSVRQYRRICWRTFGEPANSFARRVRLENAAGRIVSERIAISIVAHETGYGSTDAFVRAFRDHFGIRPLPFRELNSEKAPFLPGFLLSKGLEFTSKAQVRIAVTPEATEAYIYDGLLLLARLDRKGRIDWCPWRPRKRWDVLAQRI